MTPELKDKISTLIPAMHGWCTVEKAIEMAELVLQYKPRVIVQIGVFGGRSLIPQALALKENGFGKIYGIDPWKKEAALEGELDEANAKWWAGIDMDNMLKVSTEAVWNNGLDAFAPIIRAKAQDVVELFPNIDILEIDGNHNEISSCRDVEMWLPRVNGNGWIWFDDVDWPQTQKALSMMRAKCTEIKQVNNCKLFWKKDR